MAQQCERPACAEPAVVAYGFDPARAVAWLEPYAGAAGAGVHNGRLCRRHADAMVVPQGWWLEDRRSSEHLFATAPATRERPTRRPSRPARTGGEVVPVPLPNIAEAPAIPDDVTPDEESVDATPPAAWTPAFVVDDDLDGLLNATSPLLSRAFGQVKGSGTRQRAPGA